MKLIALISLLSLVSTSVYAACNTRACCGIYTGGCNAGYDCAEVERKAGGGRIPEVRADLSKGKVLQKVLATGFSGAKKWDCVKK